MEMFNAADEEQWQVISTTINQATCAVTITHCYGSTTKALAVPTWRDRRGRKDPK